MIDFVNYTPPTGGEWARIQKTAGFSNQQAADRLGITLTHLKRIRNEQKNAEKAVFFMLCIYANVEVILFDEPEQQQ